MGAKLSTDRPGWTGDSMLTDEGSGSKARRNLKHDEVVEVRREGESSEELSVHFGYQCQSNHGHSVANQRPLSIPEAASTISSEDNTVSVTLSNGFLNPRRNNTFSSLSGAALGANATLANSSICNGKLGEEILPGLDSPKTFRKMESIHRASSLKSDMSTLKILNSTGSHSVPAQLVDLASYASSIENANRSSFLNAKDVQVAGGAAGEDRVQAICSEDKGWLICGVYDGFNGRDAADFLAGTLLENIALHLRLLEHRAQKRQALLDIDDRQNSGDGEDTVVIDDVLIGAQQATRASNSADRGTDTTMDDFGELNDGGASSYIESSDLPQFRKGVLEGLQKALVQTESDFLRKVEQEMEERPELVMVGSCVLVVLLYGRSLYTLNLGDSRAVLATTKALANAANKPSSLYAVELTERHIAEDPRERERVMREHPEDSRAIFNSRLKGKLRVTRAFGAGYLKKAAMNNALMGILRVKDLSSPPYLAVTPSVSSLEVQPEDRFVVIGSDGMFDFFSNEEVVELINNFLIADPSGDPSKYMVEQLLARAAKNAGEWPILSGTCHALFYKGGAC